MKKLIILFITLALINTSSFSQNINDSIQLEDVVVVASKTEVSRKLVPISVSQVTKKDIENSGEINVLPLISTYSPGVFITERNTLGFGVATGGSGTINIRGVGGTPNTSVLVLIDGHPQYQGIFGHPLPDAYVASDVEKVEIIRGPASILYGSNAMAGVVNIISKKQSEDGLKTNMEASYGSYNTQKYCGTIGYKKDKLSVFASVNHDQTDGTRENTDFNITNGFTKVGYQINKHFNLNGDFSVAKYFANDNGSIYSAPAPFSIDILRGKTSISLENKYSKTEGAFKVYHNFGTHDLSDGWHSTDRNSGAMLYQTFQLFKGNKLTTGIDAKQYGGIGNNGKAKDSLITLNEIAAYAYIQQMLFNKLVLSGGLRLENNSNYGNELIPMVGINYNPTNSTTIKTTVSKGFRSPTIMEMYLYAPNPLLEPERMMNYEISWLQDFFKGRIKTELTLFDIEGKNMIQVVGGIPPKRENIGSFSNKGIEFSSKFKATKNLFIHANYSYLDLSKAVLAAPEQQLNLTANYTYKIFNANLSLQHIEKLYISTSPEITESYTLLNIHLNAKVTKFMNIFATANNLLNQDYEINYGYPMPKINFSGGIKLNF